MDIPTTSSCEVRRLTTRLNGVDEAIKSGARALFGRENTRRRGGGSSPWARAGATPWLVGELCGRDPRHAHRRLGIIAVLADSAVAGRRAPDRGAQPAPSRARACASSRLKTRQAALRNVAAAARGEAASGGLAQGVLDERRGLELEVVRAKKKPAAMGGGQRAFRDGLRPRRRREAFCGRAVRRHRSQGPAHPRRRRQETPRSGIVRPRPASPMRHGASWSLTPTLTGPLLPRSTLSRKGAELLGGAAAAGGDIVASPRRA